VLENHNWFLFSKKDSDLRWFGSGMITFVSSYSDAKDSCDMIGGGAIYDL